MIHLWLFPVLDFLFVPLLYLWNGISLTVVSLLAGVVLILVYYLTSDQWGLAYYKHRMKEYQNRLLHGDYSLETVLGLLNGNLKLASYGFIPAVFTVIPIIVLIPWVGSRFGLEPLQPREPFTVQLKSSEPFNLSLPPDLRSSTTDRSFEPGTVRLRLLAESSGTKQLIFETESGGSVRIPVAVQDPWANAWPTIGRPAWYHSLLAPAGRVLPANQPIEYVTVEYRESFPSLSLNLPGMARLPGWLNYFFLVSFLSGLAIKWSYSIE